MPKKKRPGRGPKPNRGPFTTADLRVALERDGWTAEPGAKHIQMRHPTKRGKVSLSPGWTGIKAGCRIYRSICRQAGLTKKELLALLNPGLDLK